jgi:RNA recognition motif-containing protein
VKSKEGKSMGFGFVEYESSEKAVEAVKKLNSFLVDGHNLSLSLSRKKVQSAQDLKALKEKIKQE